MESNATNKEEQNNYMNVYRDVYSIKINNALFYQQLGKFKSIMAMFKHIGFKKVDHVIQSSFTYMQDPDLGGEKETSWKMSEEESFEELKSAKELLYKSGFLQQEFGRDHNGRKTEQDNYYQKRNREEK